MDERAISAGLQAGVLLARNGFHFSHSLGQNFLMDDQLVERMVSAGGVIPGDSILEIGPGAGVMTRHLLARGARVTAVELDESLRPVLEEMLAGQQNARLIFADALKLNMAELFGEEAYRVVANLPYYITSDIIVKLLCGEKKPAGITVLVQKEAAERMNAKMGGKSWCALAATVQYFGRCEVLMDVPRECFTPQPHVDSVLLNIELHEQKPVEARDEKHFLKLLNAAFFMRRKTFANNISAVFGMPKSQAEEYLSACGLDPRVRGEAVSLSQMCSLSDKMCGFDV